MLRYVIKKIFYGFLVLLGVVSLVFFLFQGFGDPSRMVMGQSGDSTTQANIRKELYLINEKGRTFQSFNSSYITSTTFHPFVSIQKMKLQKRN
jgi:peptide/nickel transport system permease protein